VVLRRPRFLYSPESQKLPQSQSAVVQWRNKWCSSDNLSQLFSLSVEYIPERRTIERDADNIREFLLGFTVVARTSIPLGAGCPELVVHSLLKQYFTGPSNSYSVLLQLPNYGSRITSGMLFPCKRLAVDSSSVVSW